MATERKRTIKPAGQGGDYSSLSAWEAGEQADLVALDEYRVGEIDGEWVNADTTAVTIDGWTTDATRYIEVRTTSLSRHNGKWDETKYILLSSTGSSSLIVKENFVNIIGLQTQKINSTVSGACFEATALGSGAKVYFIDCIGKALTVSVSRWTNGFDLWSINGAATVYCINCLVLDANGGSADTGGFYGNTGLFYFYNCSVYNCNAGFYRGSGTMTVKNCLAQNCIDAYVGTFGASSTNNVSDMGDAPGSNPINGTVLFADIANGDFSLSPYDNVAQLAGADLYADATYPVTTDIRGISRGAVGAAFDIGAFHSTTSIRTIKQSGGNYSSLSAWEAAEQRDLVINNKVAIGEIDGDWASSETGNITIDGWTTDSIHYIEVRTTTTARHNGKWKITAHRITTGNDPGLRLVENYIRIYGLQFELTSGSSTPGGINIYPTGAVEIIIGECIGKNSGAGTGISCFRTFSSITSGYVLFRNCIAYQYNTTSSAGFIDAGTAGNVYLYNCSAYNCTTGFSGTSVWIVKNCLTQNCSNGFSGSFNGASANNCSDISSDAPGSNPVTGTVQFVDSTNGDFTLSPYDTVAQFAGANLWNDTYPVTTDIAGNSRGSATASYDIGASHALVSIRTIKPIGQGGNYVGLSSWEAGEQRDLVVNNKKAVAELDGDWSSSTDMTSITIDGWTVDVSRYIEIRAVGNARHKGKWDTTKYILENNGTGNAIYEPYCRFVGFLVRATGASSTTQRIFRNFCLETGDSEFENIIIRFSTTYGSAVRHGFVSQSTIGNNFRLRNVIVWKDSACTDLVDAFRAYGTGWILSNCMAYNCLSGFYRGDGYPLYRNCISQQCSDGFIGASDPLSSNNVSDIATDAPGSDSITATANFVDAANGDFHLTSNNPLIIRAGKDLSADQYGFNTDIDGDIRVGAWDIGADQYIDPFKWKLKSGRVTANRLVKV